MLALVCTTSFVFAKVAITPSFQYAAIGALIRAAEWADSSTPAPRPAGTLALSFPRGNPPTLDPAGATNTASAEVMVEIFSGLTTIGLDMQVHPDLAESWTISDDGTIYTFHIRADARFANGKPITAQDFKYSFERVADPALRSSVALSHLGDIVGLRERWNGRAEEISGVRVLDDRTLEITIDAPKPYFPFRLATPTAFVVDRENVEGGGRWWFYEPNGSGPFKLVDYIKGKKIELERNDLYVGTPKPAIKNITLWIDTGMSYVHRYRREELDSALVQLFELPDVVDAGNSLHWQLTVTHDFRLAYLGFNLLAPPFDDPKVRQAFALSIDKRAIAREDLSGTAIPADGYFAPGFPGYNPNLKGWEYNPDKARQLIRQSKYGDVKNFPVIILDAVAEDAAIEAAMRMIQETLGISIQLRAQPYSQFLETLYSQPLPFQMYPFGRLPEYPDPIYLEIIFDSKSADNVMGYSNAQVDALLEEGRMEVNAEKRIQIYQRAEEMILADVPWIPLFFSQNYWLTKPNVKDLFYLPFVMPRLKYVSLTDSHK
jgi:oligopeptide transport system substrate-binding protein